MGDWSASWRRRQTRSLAGVAVLMAAGGILLSGCGATSAVPSSPVGEDTVSGDQDDYDNSVAIQKCLEATGWEVTVTEDADGGWGIEAVTPNDQYSQYQDDYQTCSEQNVTIAPLDSAAAIADYEADVTISACLRAAGYSVPEIPSKQTYVSAELAETLSYSPYSLVPEEELLQAHTECHR
ncbi:MAG: hypothetical protein QM635_08680 [Microbacteriaceae bacterium]